MGLINSQFFILHFKNLYLACVQFSFCIRYSVPFNLSNVDNFSQLLNDQNLMLEVLYDTYDAMIFLMYVFVYRRVSGMEAVYFMMMEITPMQLLCTVIS